jgi:hypothetical protein
MTINTAQPSAFSAPQPHLASYFIPSAESSSNVLDVELVLID